MWVQISAKWEEGARLIFKEKWFRESVIMTGTKTLWQTHSKEGPGILISWIYACVILCVDKNSDLLLIGGIMQWWLDVTSPITLQKVAIFLLVEDCVSSWQIKQVAVLRGSCGQKLRTTSCRQLAIKWG